MRILTEAEMYPQIYNWIEEFSNDEFIRGDEVDEYGFDVWQDVDHQWYERPNEDNLLNTLTEALEGAYNYD